MLISFSVIFLFGLLFASICKKIGLPALIGMLITGIVFGPYGLDWIDRSILNISAELRQIALVIILTRAGFSLNISDLKKNGRSAILMSFLPAVFEIIGTLIIAPIFLGLNLVDSAILGSVIAAVSPAVIVPSMIKIKEENYGDDKKVPQLILAGASVDDIFVIVLFTIATNIAVGGSFEWTSLLNIPVSIISGIGVGILTGWLLSMFFTKTNIRNTVKAIIILCVAFILIKIEAELKPVFAFSGLLAVMTSGMAILFFTPELVKGLSHKFSKLWVVAEILLFVLVGTTLELSYLREIGFISLGFIFAVLVFRLLGVWISLLKSELNTRERIFCMFAYIPKATVQAAIGAIPMSMGLACGKIVLTISIASIIVTAPIGVFLIELSYKKLLNKSA